MISCLTVTKNPKKFPFIKKAIKSYCDQTFKDKELIIVCGNEMFSKKIEEYVLSEGVKNCRVVYVDEDNLGYKLGDMRNISVQEATGNIIVNWDDDDINHPLRLQTQYDFMIKNELDACFLSDQLHYFYDTNELFWVNWGEGIPGTLMCRNNCFRDVKHPSESHHEDDALKDQLFDKFKVDSLNGYGYLYMYTCNELCVFDKDHHISEIINRKDLSYMKNIYMKTKVLKYINYYGISNYSFNLPNNDLIY